MKSITSEFIKFGKMLFESGLLHLSSGNISVRKGSKIYITRTGSILGALSKKDLVTVNLKDSQKDKGASTETPIHRAIYLNNPDIQAVFHAHPIYATTLSFDMELIKPIDNDSIVIPEIPVLIDTQYRESSPLVAKKLPLYFRKHVVAMVRGHGAFAVGKNIQEAAVRISMMENQCRIIYLRQLLEKK